MEPRTIWRIGEILVQKKLINWEQLQQTLEEQKISGKFTGDILIEKGFISRSLFYKSLAEQYGLRYVDLARTRINPKAVELVARSIAQKFQIMPIEISANTLIIGISNPLTVWPQQEVKQLAKIEKIQTVLCTPSDIEEAIKSYYGAESVSATN